MRILQIIILLTVATASTALSQPITSIGETTTFTAGGERIQLPSLSIILEPDSCVRFYWEQYAITYDDLTLEQAEYKAEEMISDRFADISCYIPMAAQSRIGIVNQITQAIRAEGFTITTESGGELNLLQFWYRDEDGENLNLYYHCGSDENVLLMVQEETPLAKRRSALDEYLIEVAFEVDFKLLLGDENTEYATDCTESYPLEDTPYNAEPLYELESCEVVATWQDDGEYYVTATLEEDEVGVLTFSTKLDDF